MGRRSRLNVCWKTNNLPLVFWSNSFPEDPRLQGEEQILVFCKGKLNGKEPILVDPKLSVSKWYKVKPCNQKCLTDPLSLGNPEVGSNITHKPGCRSEAAATSDEKLAGDYNQQQEKT